MNEVVEPETAGHMPLCLSQELVAELVEAGHLLLEEVDGELVATFIA